MATILDIKSVTQKAMQKMKFIASQVSESYSNKVWKRSK